MSPPPSDACVAVSRRFFEALAALVAVGRVSSLSGFCILHGLSAPRYRALRLAYGPNPKPAYRCPYAGVQVDALVALVSDYPVSAQWLLAGRGRMLFDELL